MAETKSLVIYDSNFENTKKIADTIAEEIGGKSISVNEIGIASLKGVELLIVGSPINAWRATATTRKFLDTIGTTQLKNVKAAAFDTRVESFISGNAAKKILKVLTEKGATTVAEPIGFYVKDNKGPLLDGEILRAKNWANKINSKLK